MNTATLIADDPTHGAAPGRRISLPQVHGSVPAAQGSAARRLFAFLGPGYLVAVGYMDPGNWATSLAGGSQFGYSLLFVILVSNLMAMLFQTAAVRLGWRPASHNLYLHSSLVQTRRHDGTTAARREAIRFATIDSTVALGLALLINGAILVLAAGAFHRPGGEPVSELGDAYRLLSPLLGVAAASTLFGVALVCSGLSASVTGTLAGQIVMEGFLDLRISPAARALLTRSFAIVPAVVVVLNIWMLQRFAFG